MNTLVTVRLGPVSTRLRRRSLVVNVVLVVLIATCVVAALLLGKYGLSFADLWDAVRGDGSRRIERTLDRRMRRALAAILFGACLGVSGMIFQSLTRNPLGSPDVIGLNAGAYTGVIAVLTLGGSGYAAIAAGAITGSLIAAAAVFAFAYRGGLDGFRLIIVGIAIGAILTSLNHWFSVKADLDEAMKAAIWGAGSLNSVQWEPLLAASCIAVLCLPLLPPLSFRIRQLELGDDAAAALGLRVERTRIQLIFVGVLFTALVAAVAGPIAFVALAAPQIAKRMHGRSAMLTVTGSALVGAVLLSAADLVAQYGFGEGSKLPVGAVTVVLGGVYLIWLLLRESARS